MANGWSFYVRNKDTMTARPNSLAARDGARAQGRAAFLARPGAVDSVHDLLRVALHLRREPAQRSHDTRRRVEQHRKHTRYLGLFPEQNWYPENIHSIDILMSCETLGTACDDCYLVSFQTHFLDNIAGNKTTAAP